MLLRIPVRVKNVALVAIVMTVVVLVVPLLVVAVPAARWAKVLLLPLPPKPLPLRDFIHPFSLFKLDRHGPPPQQNQIP